MTPETVSPGTRTNDSTILSDIEIVHPQAFLAQPQHVLFDFDGTLSLVRAGWAQIMADLAVEALSRTKTEETPAQLRRLALDFIMELNGRPAIHQLTRLGEEVVKRRGQPKDPRDYLADYNYRLMARVHGRREQLRHGQVSPADLTVPGALEFLAILFERGITLYLASGTDHAEMVEEAELLGLPRFFGMHLYGATGTDGSFSKERLIADILRENRVDGRALLSFGDGCVEIRNVKAVGGVAVAVASDELERSGKNDPWKRAQLIAAGADMVIPDFRAGEKLVQLFWP